LKAERTGVAKVFQIEALLKAALFNLHFPTPAQRFQVELSGE
jgi:hypothetical protein